MSHKKVNYLPLILLPVIILICFWLWSVDNAPVPCVTVDSTTGVFDMRDIDFRGTIAGTERTAEYVLGVLLTPEEFALRDDIQFGSVPNDPKVCTMRVRYLVPENIHYGIGGYSTNYASSVYINGDWIFDAGKPALTLEGEQATESYRLFSAQPVDGVIEIVIQTSGFANVDETSWMEWYISEYENTRIHFTRIITKDFIVMSWYLLLALVFLLLFPVLPSYKANVWLSLLSLVWAIRVGLKGRKILLTLFPIHTWDFVYKAEIITSPLTILLLALVLHSVFTGALPKWLRAVIMGGSTVMALAVIILPWPTFLGHSVWSNPIIYWSIAVMLGFILYSMWHTKTKPTIPQIIIIAGMIMAVFAFMWDENYFSHGILPYAITQPMMLVFTIFMFVATMLETMQKTVTQEVALTQTVESQKRELTESRISVMLSQIQPHFLYNSLSAIENLCVEDPMQARDTVRRFAKYLRENLGSLTQRELIPFSRELAHIHNYMALEQTRFREKLQVVYEIEAPEFSLPPLTVQPIMENAVRNGIHPKKGGGTITLRTAETDDYFIVTITDDGVGFNTDTIDSLDETHIGLVNVRERLRLCGGTFAIESTPGKGTVATIRIPKKGGDGHYEHHSGRR